MSLQVWLPLNGDLHNQGLNNIQPIGNGITLDNNGKIGKCYSFNGSNSISINKVVLPSQTPNWSFACWFLFTDTTVTSANCFFSERTGTTSTGYSIFIYPSTGRILVDDGVRWNFIASMTFTQDVWYHLVITRSPSEKKLYINGELKNSTSTVGNTSTINTNGCLIGLAQTSTALTTGNQGLVGKLNDVRIYDHCLSQKEIEEISKGLVLHYKLDGPKESVPTPEIPENLFIGTGFSTNDVASMVGNSSTDWTKYFRWYNGSKAIHSFSDGVDTITLNATSNLGIAFERKATDINLDPNSYYTISCEAKCTKSGAQLGIGTSYYTTANAWVWRGGANKFTFNAVNTWQKFSYTFKPDSNTQYICYCFTCNNGTSGGTNTLSIRHCKLEKGSIATEWVLNKLDDTYIAPNQDDTWSKEFDCSGYGNDATIIGTSVIENNSSRFSQCIHMTNTSTANRIQSNNNVPLLTDGITASFWVKCAKATGQVIFAHPNFEFGLLNSLGYVSLTSAAGFNLSNFITNEWNHICVIRNGTTYKLYVNGVAAPQNGANNSYTHNASNLYLLNRSYNNNYAANASLSDFRLYATELTEAQIKELYNTSATIDNKGNGYAREEIEDSNLNITKTGQFHNGELLDNDDYTTASITKTDKQLKVNNFYEY